MKRRSKFTYGISSFEATISARPWTPRDSTVGGTKVAAAGVPASYTVRRDNKLVLTLRFYEEQWEDVLALVTYGQLGLPVQWQPDADDAADVDVYIDDPAPGGEWEPARSSEFPRMLEATLTLRATTGSAFTPYFDGGGSGGGGGGGGGSPSEALSLDDLLNVIVPAAADGDLLMFNGLNWINTKNLTGSAYTFAGTVTANNDRAFRATGSGNTWLWGAIVATNKFGITENGVNSPLVIDGAGGPVTITRSLVVAYDDDQYLTALVTSAGLVLLTATGDTPSFTFSNPVTVADALVAQDGVTITTSAANMIGLDISGGLTSGSSAVGLVTVAHTWNTSGVPTLIDVNIAISAMGAGSKVLNLRSGSNPLFIVGAAGTWHFGRYDSATAYMSMTLSTTGGVAFIPAGSAAFGYLEGFWGIRELGVDTSITMAAEAPIYMAHDADETAPAITRLGSATTGLYFNDGLDAVAVAHGGAEVAVFYGNGTDHMGLQLRDYTGDAVKQVKRGAADSGGSGKRLLCVDN